VQVLLIATAMLLRVTAARAALSPPTCPPKKLTAWGGRYGSARRRSRERIAQVRPPGLHSVSCCTTCCSHVTPEMPIVAFADGAAKGNPGPGGWGAILVTPTGEVTELGGGAAHTTNNRMELTAAIEALRAARAVSGPVALHTDSTYVIRGVREWIHAWRRRGWKTTEGRDVVNRDLWETLASEQGARAHGSVTWHYVRGHTGIPGNERSDEIANAFATGRRPRLYHGPLVRYAVAVLDLPEDTRVPARAPGGSRRRPAAPHSYLSLVDGKPERHATWAECERRVKGRSGARFKKALSPSEEAEILRAWGFNPEDL
jgi:ribonuclease HI